MKSILLKMKQSFQQKESKMNHVMVGFRSTERPNEPQLIGIDKRRCFNQRWLTEFSADIVHVVGDSAAKLPDQTAETAKTPNPHKPQPWKIARGGRWRREAEEAN